MSVSRSGALRGRALVSALMASSALAAAPAWAQSASPSSTASDVQQEVVVTALRREESIQRVPMSIQALDSRTLERLNVTEFQDYVKLMPSVAFQTLGPNQTSIYMRGVSSGDNANHSGPLPSVGVYFDEQPITTIGGTLDIHVYDIARIEVLPGPQGTLYGASSEAGTMRIISNKPSAAGFSAGYDLEGNTVEHGSQGYVAEGFVNVPLASNAAVRLVAWDEHDAGFIDNVPGSRVFPTSGATVTNDGLVKTNSNPADTIGGRAALKVDLNSNWTIEPTVIYQDQRNKGVFGYEPSVGELQAERFQPDTDHDRFVQAALTILGKIGDYSLTYSGGFFDRKVNQRTDYTDYSVSYDLAYGSGAFWQDNNGNLLANPLQSIVGRDHFSKNSQELRVASPASDRLRFIAGLFYERQTHWIIQDYQIQGLADSLSVPGWANTIWLTDQMRVDRDDAVYGEATYDVTSKFSITAGIRGYEYDNQLHGFFGFSEGYDALTGYSSGMGADGSNCIAGTKFRDAPCVNLNKTVSGSGETHKINATYKFTPDKLVYFTYSTGYRPGGVNRNGNFGPYQADTLDNYEIGWKTSWFGHKLVWNGAVYYEDWNKFQFSFLGPNSLTVIENAPEGVVKGVETSVDWYPVHNLSISGNLGYTDAELAKNFCGTDQTTGQIIASCANADAIAVKGTPLPYTPKYKGSLTARYAFPIGDWEGHVQATGAYQSRNNVGLRTSDIEDLGAMPSYGTMDLSFGVLKNGLSVEFFAKNLTDSLGQQNRFTPCTVSVCSANYGAGYPQAIYVVPITPRLIGIKFGQKF